MGTGFRLYRIIIIIIIILRLDATTLARFCVGAAVSYCTETKQTQIHKRYSNRAFPALFLLLIT